MTNTLTRASDNSRGRGPAKFRYFREIPRNSSKNTKYREIRQKYFQMHVGKIHLILILAIRPVLFTSNVQIYLETSSLQRVNNVSKLPGVLDERCKNWALTIMLTALAFAHFSSELLLKEQVIIPVKKTLNNAGHIDAKLIDFSEICQKHPAKSAVFY